MEVDGRSHAWRLMERVTCMEVDGDDHIHGG